MPVVTVRVHPAAMAQLDPGPGLEAFSRKANTVKHRPRRLPYSAARADGESLSSWIDRTARLLDLQRRDLWLHVGLIDKAQQQPTAYGVVLPPSRRRTLSATTGMSEIDIDSLLLSRYSVTVVPWDKLNTSDAASIRGWARSAWVFVWPSHACPQCVRETEGVWQLAWKLPWSFACPAHHSYLLSECPSCGGRLQGNVLDARQSLLCCASAPGLTRARSDGRARSRRHPDDICGALVGDFHAPAATSDAIGLQRRLNHLISLGETAGDDLPSLEEVRRLTTFALYLGVPELLTDSDPVVRRRFEQHIESRDVQIARRGDHAAAKYRQYSLPIVDPLLAAGALTVAGRLAYADDLDTAWQHVMDTVFSAHPNAAGQWWQLQKFWTPPAKHAGPLERARTRTVFVVSSLDGRARTRGRRSPSDVNSRHVPALLWPEAYRFLADGLIERGSVVAGRRFAALSLARHVQPDLSDWAAATDALGLDAIYVANCYRWIGRFRREGCGRLFESRLDHLARQLLECHDRVDYRQRREAFADLDIADDDWTSIGAASGVDAGDRWWLRRRHQAAAWLWETLTGGDWHHAPSLHLAQLSPHERGVASNAYIYYFKGKHLPKVEAALTEFAGVLLQRHQLDGPLTMDLRSIREVP